MYAFLPCRPATLETDQQHYRRCLQNNTHFNALSDRVPYSTYGVRIQIDRPEDIFDILGACELPYIGHVETRMVTNEGGIDLWINVEGESHGNTPTEITVPPEFQYPILLGPFTHNREFQQRAREILKILTDMIGRPIVCKKRGRPVGLHQPTGNINAFTIWVHAGVNSTSRDLRPPERMWGHPVRYSDPSYAPSGTGQLIIDETSGWCAGEVFPDHMFIHHALLGSDMSELDILEEIVHRAVGMIGIDPAAWATRREALAEEVRRRSRKAYAALVGKRLERTLEEKRYQLAALPQEITTTRARVHRLITKQGHEMQMVRAMEASREEQRLKDVFNRIYDLPQIEKVRVSDDQLINVYTAPLFYKNPVTNAIHKLGRLKIVIGTQPPDYRKATYLVKLDRELSITDRPAPHMSAYGYLFLDGQEELVKQLYVDRDWEQLVRFAINNVQAVNVEAAGKYIHMWPLATPNELVGTEWEGMQVEATPEAVA